MSVFRRFPLFICFVLTTFLVVAFDTLASNKNESYSDVEHWLSLAKLGHGQSQYKLANYYEKQGTSASIRKAYAWYLMAKQNNVESATTAFKRLRSTVKNKRQAKQEYLALREMFSPKVLAASLYPKLRMGETDVRWPTNQTLISTKNGLINIPKQIRRKYKHAWSLWLYDLDWTGRIINLRLLANSPDSNATTALEPLLRNQQFKPVINKEGMPKYVIGVSQLVSFGFNPNNRLPTLVKKKSNNDVLANALMAQYFNFDDKWSDASSVLTAAISGQTDAQFQIAMCLLEGNFCIKDHNKAQQWLHTASIAGHQYASFQLAKMRKDKTRLGQLAKQDYSPAMYYYPKLLVTDNKRLLAYKIAYQNTLVMPQSPLFLYSAGQMAESLGLLTQSAWLKQKARQVANKYALPQDYLTKIK